MLILIAQVVIALIPVISKLIDKLVPDMATRKREFKTKKKVINGLNNFHGKMKDGIERKTKG